MRRPRRIRGVTLMEALMGAVLTAMALGTTVSVYFTGMFAWVRGEGKITSESYSHTAIRVVANELRQAMFVQCDSNGLGLTYMLPLQDGTGTDVVPVTPDGVTRRIELDGSTINMIANGVDRKICSGVILTDPLSVGGTQAYQIFTPGIGTTTRSITVEIVSQADGAPGELEDARNRETIYLRNVPQIVY